MAAPGSAGSDGGRGGPVTEANRWRRCSACKQPIALGATYWICNVSTCNRKRTGLAFCSVSCWEVHLPSANHREAWALERTAPATADAAEEPPATEKPAGRRVLVRDTPPAAPADGAADAPKEILIVASRLKDYVRARSGFNTSERALGPLSDIVRRVCDRAIDNAARDGRKTVLDRDIPKP